MHYAFTVNPSEQVKAFLEDLVGLSLFSGPLSFLNSHASHLLIEFLLLVSVEAVVKDSCDGMLKLFASNFLFILFFGKELMFVVKLADRDNHWEPFVNA